MEQFYQLRIGLVWGNSKTQFSTKYDKLSKRFQEENTVFDQVEM